VAIVNGYATQAQLKQQATLDLDDDKFDDLLDRAINATSRGLDRFCKRHFYQDAGARIFAATHTTWFDLPTFCDLVSVDASGLRTDEDGDGVYERVWAVSDFELQPVNIEAGPEPRPYRSVVAIGSTLRFPVPRTGSNSRVQITGTWGWPAIPAAIEEAALLQAHRLFKRREAPEGVVGLNMFGTVRMGRLDPDVRGLARPYRLLVAG
jgi:hypothetical protein